MIDNLTHPIQLMLEACLAGSRETREQAVRLWEEHVIIDDMDFGASRLVPYFFHLNKQDGIETVHDKRLKVIYKHWWLRSHHITHQLKIVHNALSEEGIRLIIYKGAAIKLHYERDELRPMADFDLLIQPSDLQKTLQILKGLDYTMNPQLEGFLQKKKRLFLEFSNEICCKHRSNECKLDLHWRVGYRHSAEFSDELWHHLEDYPGIQGAQKPRLAYEVFLLIVHAVDSRNNDNFNWVLDIDLINKKYGKSFWDEARRLAVKEKKADLFDYGCSVLLHFGVFAPDPGKVTKPRGIVSTGEIQRAEMSFWELFITRLANIKYGVDRRFPHAGLPGKFFRVVRGAYYQYILGKNRSMLS
jgi:hypothetical protein